MRKPQTIKNQLLLAFLVFTAMIVLLSAASFFFLERSERIKEVKTDIDQLHLLILHLIKTDYEFFTYESNNQLFFQTGESTFLKRRAALSFQITKEMEKLISKEELQQYDVSVRLAAIKKLLIQHDSVFQTVVEKMRTRGFKDYGLEGKMRQHAHELENYTRQINMIDLLTLRRHEKDFFLRGESVYVNKLNHLSQSIISGLSKNNPEENKWLIGLVSSYTTIFNQLVQIENEIGNDYNEGLRKTLDTLNKQIENRITLVAQETTEIASEMTRRVKIMYVITVFISIVVSILISYFSSRKLATPIGELSDKINHAVFRHFQDDVKFDFETSTTEVNMLSNSFQNMLKEIKSQFQLIHVKSVTLEIQNERLRHTNQMLKKSEKELMETNAVKDKFFSIIAHDLKGPIATLTSFLHILITYSDGFSREETKHLAINMSKSVNNLSILLENLLEWSRSQMGSLDFSRKAFSLSSSLQKVLNLLNTRAEEKNITLVADLDPAVIVYADENMVEFILRNLVSNAIKFSFPGDTITIVAIEGDEMVEISVIDNGVGIEEADLGKIFKQGTFITKPGTAQEKGTGLGLLLSKEFVEKNDGKLWVESKPQKGSIFRFTLQKDFKMAKELEVNK